MEKFAIKRYGIFMLHMVLDFPNSSILAFPVDLFYLANRTGSGQAPEAHETVRL